MRSDERDALAAVQFNWAVTPDDIWSPVEHHVDELHRGVVRTALAAFSMARQSRGPSPLGVALRGEKGVGKTHLLGWLRQQVQDTGGYFFLIKLVSGGVFWPSAVRGVMDGLRASHANQLSTLLGRLAEHAGLNGESRSRLVGQSAVRRQDVDSFLTGLRATDEEIVLDCGNTIRALILSRSPEAAVQEIGYSYFELDGFVEDPDRETWGFRRGPRLPQQILGDLSRLIALTGPSVIAVDQLDSLLAQISTARADEAPAGEIAREVNEIADGLMELREVTRRAVTVVACLPATWQLIDSLAVGAAADRFRIATMQSVLPSAAVVEELVSGRLGALYSAAAFVPPYPTWPILQSALADPRVRNYTPRRVLQRVDAHVRRCLETDELIELADLEDEVPGSSPAGRHAAPPGLNRLDERFAQLRAEADVDAAVDPATEDTAMPELLAAALSCFISELGDGGPAFELDPPPGSKPALHARLRRTLDERTDDEMAWSFRGIASHHHLAALTRLRAARTAAGLSVSSGKRRLVVIRNTEWSKGPKTTEELTELETAGGMSLVITEDDLRTFAALVVLRRRPDPGFLGWLSTRRPVGNSELFRQVFADHAAEQPPQIIADPEAGRQPEPMSEEPMVQLGIPVGGDQPFVVPLRTLRKHTVAFAGSGSGKTVMLRRLVEECALYGVSSIVLDPNNDLARLGDAWPEAPDGWLAGDAAKAREYLEQTEVVVWTPRREKGRPLSFQPLPDFSGALDDPDEFNDALDAAVAGLLPRAHLTGRRARNGEAVLRQALNRFARAGGSDLRKFIAFLADLPDDVSSIRSAGKLAEEIADSLNAGMVNDPLFGGDGEALDPGVLLTPSSGYRARVSVISFVGLQTDEQRQSFVNQLQMSLFAWIKRNPAGDRPLGGLLVMDEAQNFASSGAATACTESTLALATQARKYGLGLVFATQAPKALHNRIPGNATTQIYGLLNVTVQINAAKELAKAKGGTVDQIARLTAGEFYAATEGTAFARIRVPMCLSHHPASALTVDEVIARARPSG
ncbi:AAA family ATPase [Kribbella sp. NPDC051587]|uniref:AAA family ATPase n=1 Tax=Kribbella sp. NPDC051587 TaxID=3364119 RepID=UPI0037898C4E